MSVMYFTDQELSQIFESLSFIVCQSDFIIDISDEKLRQFITRVGICNRLAYRFNYSRDTKELIIEIPEIREDDYSTVPLKKLIERLDLLDYNCITNSGQCYLDSKDKELLARLTNSLRLRYIRELERIAKSPGH